MKVKLLVEAPSGAKLYRLAPLPQLQLIFRRFFGVHPAQVGSISLSVDPKLGKTFNVDYTLPSTFCYFSLCFVCGTSPTVLEALGPVKHEGPAWQATSTAAFTLSCQGSFAVTASFALAPLPVTSAPCGSVSKTVTEPFPFLRPWHSYAPCLRVFRSVREFGGLTSPHPSAHEKFCLSWSHPCVFSLSPCFLW